MSSFADLQHSRPLAIWATSATVANCPEIITMSWPSSGWKSKIYWRADTTSFPPASSFGRNSLFQFHSVIKELTVNFVYRYVGEWTRKITHFRVLFLSFWICYSTKVFYLKISENTSRIRLVYFTCCWGKLKNRTSFWLACLSSRLTSQIDLIIEPLKRLENRIFVAFPLPAWHYMIILN